MRFHEAAHKQFIIWVVMAVVGLLILGALSYGPGAWTYFLQYPNQTVCVNGITGNCNATYASTSAGSAIITMISGTVVVILLFIAVVLKLL